ncbi:M23 family metallopeptidase [Clostridium gasigenes]|uniref:Peptidase family M23 n=1 Tax=Clostridium gasigenes TaxID=94869 RepID=A0A1H0RVW8_9CLOT|nr:M23 family metallopeptidase [Clostridium gasigenes]MBB6622618.1 M23 family metallopeptidase [Clostridium gasigenes]MBU3088550.1 M23 family metallopeptidase [Clostridium gasigenes]MBU3103854.1 M23 family metallopeptidase [Clostridium gasigenes]MBU3132805.1 M23 family metallopeptidase [Clostridium gasigenes]MBU3136574.1 M23 family metallopeptidase [Clostridium gasigenes]
MDNKKKDKVKDFFRKEGFYVALFFCLCIVATVAAVTMKSNKKVEQAKKPAQEFSLNVDNNDVSTEKQNAERVKSETETERVADATTAEDVNVAAGTTTEVKFTNPVEGTIAREFSYPKPKEMKDGSFRNIKGIDIETKVGTPVKSSAEGVVEVITNDVEEGSFIIITHANGIKTKYANLEKAILVKKGDKVTSETVIGKVGDSSKIFSNKDFGEHINIQVLNSKDEQMDPTKYFNYKA